MEVYKRHLEIISEDYNLTSILNAAVCLFARESGQ